MRGDLVDQAREQLGPCIGGPSGGDVELADEAALDTEPIAQIRLEDRECPLSSTLGLVGEWWTLLILHDAFDGYRRFDEFQQNLGISSSLLTSRLKRLVAEGVLERRPYRDNPPRHEYVLTPLGRSLRPVVVALAAWGNSRLAPEQRSMVLVDAATGEEAEPVLVDARTGRRVDGPDFVFTAGPAASDAFRRRYAGIPSGQPDRATTTGMADDGAATSDEEDRR